MTEPEKPQKPKRTETLWARFTVEEKYALDQMVYSMNRDSRADLIAAIVREGIAKYKETIKHNPLRPQGPQG